MNRKTKRNVPYEGNEVYYNGLRSILSGTIYSIIGTYITALMTGKINLSDLLQFPLVVIHLLPLVCLGLWWSSYKRPNVIICSIGPIWYYPRIAKFILALQCIMIGVMCSLIFDVMSNPYSPSGLFIIGYFSLAVFYLLLLCFSSLSIQSFSE